VWTAIVDVVVSRCSVRLAAECPSVFFFQAEDGIRGFHVTGVQTCALPILLMPLSANTELISLITPGMFWWMCSRRCLPGCDGRATSGKLTEDTEVPLSLYLTSFSATSRPMLAWASA